MGNEGIPVVSLDFLSVFSLQINSVRMAINLAIGNESTVTDWGQDAVLRIQTDARAKLLQLVLRKITMTAHGIKTSHC